MTNNSIIIRGKNDEKINKKISVGLNIKQLRRMMGITQKELARDTFIDSRRISKIENEDLSPTIGEMERISVVLQVSVLALFFNVKVAEVNCDRKTGLNENAIQWLTKLNRNHHEFIDMLNALAVVNPKSFNFIYDAIKLIFTHHIKGE